MVEALEGVRVLADRTSRTPDMIDGQSGWIKQQQVGRVPGGHQAERGTGDRIWSIKSDCPGRCQRNGGDRVRKSYT